MLVLAVVLSLFVGILLGLLGGGGSILMVPILRYVLDIETHRAIAMSLLVVGATSLGALVPHARAGRVRLRTGLAFGAAGMAGAFVAARIARFIPGTVLLFGLAAVMFATAAAMLRGAHREAPAQPHEHAPLRALSRLLLQGFFVGGLAGLVGAGGGFVIVPALLLLGRLPMPEAVGTSLVVLAMNSFAGLAGTLSSTSIELPLALAITASAVAGSVVGGFVAGRTDPSSLRRGFGFFVLAMAGFILGQELPPLLGMEPSLLRALALDAAVSALALALLRARHGPPQAVTSEVKQLKHVTLAACPPGSEPPHPKHC